MNGGRVDGAPGNAGNWKEEAARIQALYRKNRKRAVQEVLDGPSRQCEISVEEVQRHFEQVHAAREPGGELPPFFEQDEPSAASCDALCAPFTAYEVCRRLRGMSNTAPGPDGVTYDELRRADKGGHVLAAMFNACLRTQLVSACWKESSTVLLHKKGDRGVITNWRPIAMGDTTAKLFTSMLAERLTNWATSNGRISAPQKGFLQYEGCYEYNFVLQEMFRDFKHELVIAWLDLG